MPETLDGFFSFAQCNSGDTGQKLTAIVFSSTPPFNRFWVRVADCQVSFAGFAIGHIRASVAKHMGSNEAASFFGKY